MNNTTVGNKTESNSVSIFRKHRFWVYNCPKSSSGSQPCDIIAAHGNTIYLADGKHVRSNEVSFTFSRVEDNQAMSFRYASDFAGMDRNNMGFSIEFERTGEIYWLPVDKYLEMTEKGLKSVNLKDLILLEDKLNG